MNIDNKRALIILTILIVILTAITIIVGRIVVTVDVEPKKREIDNNIGRQIDFIVDGDIEGLNEEQASINEVE